MNKIENLSPETVTTEVDTAGKEETTESKVKVRKITIKTAVRAAGQSHNRFGT